MAAGKSVRLRCESRGGNPPAEIYWYIDDELLTESSQKNETEVGDDRKWNAISVLRIVFKKVWNLHFNIHFANTHRTMAFKSKTLTKRRKLRIAVVKFLFIKISN